MCLIAVKPVGVKAPSNKEFRSWCDIHPDGAGMAFNDRSGGVHILKGALNYKEFISLHDKMRGLIKPLKPEQVNIVYHFRQATEGVIAPHNCHPFPICDNPAQLGSTDVIVDKAIAHNGIIYEYGMYKAGKWDFKQDDYTTDTQKFIINYLVGLGDAIYNESVKKLIVAHTDSKFAILDSRGVSLIGRFEQDGGMYYSNSTYLRQPIVVTGGVSTDKFWENYDKIQAEKARQEYYDNKDEEDWVKDNYFFGYKQDDSVMCEYCNDDVKFKDTRVLYDSLVCQKCYGNFTVDF